MTLAMNSTKKGDRVSVFNQVSDNWIGTVVAINKKTARVRVESKTGVFTHHAPARNWQNSDYEEYLVPYGDLLGKAPSSSGTAEQSTPTGKQEKQKDLG